MSALTGRMEKVSDLIGGARYRLTAPQTFRDGDVMFTVQWEDDAYWVARLDTADVACIGTSDTTPEAAIVDLVFSLHAQAVAWRDIAEGGK